MAKQISSLSVTLGATVAPFVNAFSGIGSVVRGFVSSIEGAGASLAKFTGLSAGVGAAMRAVRGAGSGLLGTFATFTGAGLAVNAISGAFERLANAPLDAIAAAQEQANAETKLRAVLAATGGAAGRTADQMIAYASSLEASTTFDDASIIGFQSVLATFKNISGDTFDSATKAALDMSTVMGTDLQTTAVQLGKALNDPIEGVTALRRVGVSFTDAQLAQIKTMTEANNVAGAQAIVLKELQSEFGGAAEAVAKTPFGKLKQIGNAFEDALKPVGAILANVGAEIADAINLKGIATSVESTLTNIAPMIQGAVSTYLPIVVGFASSLWQTIVDVGGRIASYVGTAVAPIVSFLAANWQTIVADAASYLMAVYGYVSGIFTAAVGIVAATGGAIVDAWNWSMNALGMSTLVVGGTTTDVFTQMGNVASWLAGFVTTTFVTLGYLFTNWRDVVELVLTQFSLGIVTAGNQVGYVFGTVVPTYLNYLADNWRNIFLDILHGDEVILGNMGSNLKAFFAAVAGWLHGDGFNFQWTGLTEGFQSSMSALPQIADRQMGGVESALTDQLTGLQDKIGDGLGNALAGNKDAGKDAAKGIAGAIGKLPPIKMPAPIAVDTKAAIGALKGVGSEADDTADKANNAADAVKKSVAAIPLIAAGGAEQWTRIAKAQADALATPPPVKIKGTPTTPAVSVPVPTATTPVGKYTNGVDTSQGIDTPAWYRDPSVPTQAMPVVKTPAMPIVPPPGNTLSTSIAGRALIANGGEIPMDTRAVLDGIAPGAPGATAQTPQAQPTDRSVENAAREAATPANAKPVDGVALMAALQRIWLLLDKKGLLAFEEVG